MRLGTTDVDVAQAQLTGVKGVVLHNQEVLGWEDVPSMLHFSDPDGDGLVYPEDSDDS